jgi:integrase
MANGSVIRYEGKRGVAWRIKYADAIGRQVMETVGREDDGVTERLARELLQERVVDVRRKGYRKPTRLTFGSYRETWYEQGVTRRRWSALTVSQYAQVLDRLGESFDRMPLDGIRPRHVAAYIAEHTGPYSAATVSRDISILHDVLATAMREELIDSNPASGAERPKLAKRKWRILTPAEVSRVYRAFTDEQARTVFLTLVLTGVRRDELRELRWRDVDLLQGVLRVRGTKSEDALRSIALSPALITALEEHYRRTNYRGDDELIFCHEHKGTRYPAPVFTEQFRSALKAAGIDDYVRPFHDLRHTSITNGAAAGESPIALMTRAGHSNMATTRRYLHLAGTVFPDEAVALERRLLASEPSTEPSTKRVEPELTREDLGRATTRL